MCPILMCAMPSLQVAVEKFAPSRRWQVDTLITMLSIAGNHCDDHISSYIAMYLALEVR